METQEGEAQAPSREGRVGSGAVEGVARHREAAGGEVDADLVPPPGADGAGHEGVPLELLDELC